MKSTRTFPLVEVSVVFFAAFLSRDLINAWRHSPHDRLGWLALLVWLVPLALRLADISGTGTPANFILMGAAIVCGLLGDLAEVHFLDHVALALALGAWLKFSWRTLPWLLSAVAWMPVCGWWLAGFSAGTILTFRLALALAGATCFWLLKTNRPS